MAEDKCRDISIDIPEPHKKWWDGLQRKLEEDPQAQANEARTACCIFTVPKALVTLKDKETAYLPQIVSLGPHHFLKSEQFSSMEKIKWDVAHLAGKDFLSKIVERIMEEKEGKWIRHHYDKEIEMRSKMLAWTMAVDASFILQFLRQRLLGQTEQRKGLIDSLPLVETLKDIVKLENQIPLSVLSMFVEIEREGKNKTVSEEQKQAPVVKPSGAEDPLNDVLQNICRKLSPISTRNPRLKAKAHILECLRSYVVSSDPEQKSSGVQEKFNCFHAVLHSVVQCFLAIVFALVSPCLWKRKNDYQAILPPAVELHKAGINFKPTDGGVQGIRFEERRRMLHLPVIKVDIHTETIMRNMMAFELCSAACKDEAPITRCAHLMDQLISTDQDVALLSKYGIIRNKLENDSKVADFWNSLTDSTSVSKYGPIDKANKDLKTYYQRRRTTAVILWNEFLEAHCTKPWHVLALVASTMALVVTVSVNLWRFSQ